MIAMVMLSHIDHKSALLARYVGNATFTKAGKVTGIGSFRVRGGKCQKKN